MQTKKTVAVDSRVSESSTGLDPRVEFVVGASLRQDYVDTDFVHSILGRIFAKIEDGAEEKETGYIRASLDYAGRTVDEDALPGTKAAVLEQPLPRGQARHDEGRAHREVDVARQRCEIACLDGHILRQSAVAIPIGEAEHPLSNRQPRRAIAESGHHSSQFVSRD